MEHAGFGTEDSHGIVDTNEPENRNEIAPDLIGFGRSDKPTERADYTYERHVGWLKQFIEALDLQDITLFGQDWGGLSGLRLAAENPDRFARIAIGNTGLPTGEQPLGSFFDDWQKFSQTDPEFNIGDVVIMLGQITDMSDAVRAGYNAPFPEEKYKSGARQFPMLVPNRPDNPASDAVKAAWRVLEAWEKPFLTAFSDGDFSVQAGIHTDFQNRVPGAAGQNHTVLKGAGHFLQEQVGPDLAAHLNAFIADTPKP